MYQTGGSKCEIRGCSKCENRLLHESCFSQLCSKCVSVTIYIYDCPAVISIADATRR